MTRLAPVPFEEWDTDALSVITGGRPLVPSNVLGLFANHPPLAKAFLTWNGYLLDTRSELSDETYQALAGMFDAQQLYGPGLHRRHLQPARPGVQHLRGRARTRPKR